MVWFYLSLLTAVSYAVVNIVDKWLLLRYAKSDAVAIKVLGLFSATIALILLASIPTTRQLSPALILPIAAGIFEIISIFYYLKAIEKELLAYLIPIFSLAPMIVLGINRFFFGESVGLLPLIGIVLTIVGVIVLVIAKEGTIQIKETKAVMAMLVSTFFSSVSSICLDKSLETHSLLMNLVWSRVGVFVGALVIAALTGTFHVREFRQPGPFMFVISELLYLVTMYLFIASLQLGSAAYVNGVLNTQPLFVFGFTYLLCRFAPNVLKEEFRFRYTIIALLSILIMAIGSWMITL